MDAIHLHTELSNITGGSSMEDSVEKSTPMDVNLDGQIVYLLTPMGDQCRVGDYKR